MKLSLRLVTALACLLAMSAAMAQDKPQSAASVLDAAKKQAKAQKKNIFLTFDASWCGWCKKLEAFLAHKDYKPIFENHFVIVKLDVLEQPDKKNLENPGGDAVLKRLGGEKAGLPYTAMLDHNAQVIVTSNRDNKAGQNIGHPFAPEEVEWFMAMLQRAAPRMTQADKDKIRTFLKSQKQ